MSTNLPTFKTADICDSHSGQVRVLPPTLLSYGGLSECAGEVVTIRLAENNAILRELFAEQGHGRIVVVDVGEEYFAVVGDNLAGMAIENGWSGNINSPSKNGWKDDKWSALTVTRTSVSLPKD